MKKNPLFKNHTILQDKQLWLIIAASVIIRSLAASLMGPGFDEAYYHLFPKYPAWGYFDHPPMINITVGIGYWLTGIWTPITLRLGAILVFSLALIGFYELSNRLYGRKAAILTVLFLHATPYFTVGAGAFVIPDNALILTWIWALVIAARIREGSINKTYGFILLGIITGVAFLAKYHAVLLPASLVIASIFDKEIRSWWKDWRLYLTLLVAIFIFSPCILWNASNGWISFAEQFGKSASGGFRIRFDLFGQAIGGQLAYLTPWVAVAIWIGVIKSWKSDKEKRWLHAFFYVPVIGMTLIGLSRGILPHWTMPGYVSGIVLAAGLFSNSLSSVKKTFYAISINLLLIVFVLVQAQWGIIPLKPRTDPTLDPSGWKASVEWLEEEGVLKDDDLLFAHKWFAAGELAWADGGEHTVVIIGKKPHNFAWWAPAPEYLGQSGILITQAWHKIDIEKDYSDRFVHIDEIDLPAFEYKGRKVEMKAWKMSGFIKAFPQPYGPYSE